MARTNFPPDKVICANWKPEKPFSRGRHRPVAVVVMLRWNMILVCKTAGRRAERALPRGLVIE